MKTLNKSVDFTGGVFGTGSVEVSVGASTPTSTTKVPGWATISLFPTLTFVGCFNLKALNGAVAAIPILLCVFSPAENNISSSGVRFASDVDTSNSSSGNLTNPSG